MTRVRTTLVCLAVAGIALASYVAVRPVPSDVEAGTARPASYPLAVVDELLALPGASGHIDGRLTGGAASTETMRRSSERTPVPAEVHLAVAKVELRAREMDGAAAEAALATASLIKGDVERALHLFDSALDQDPSNAALWSDAAAAYLTVAARKDRPELAVRALAAAGHALSLRSDLREAQFNRALALESVGLVEQAAAAWRAYRQPSDPWSGQASAHEAALLAFTRPVDAWPSFRNQLVARADANLPRHPEDATKIAPFRQEVREWIERDLLPGWGRAVLDHDSSLAGRRLRRARYAAEALIAGGGDDQPLQGIRAITAAGSPALLARLADAHLALADAMQLFDEVGVAAAAKRFAEARPAFALARSSYARWSTVYESVALYAGRQLPRAWAALDADATRDGSGRYLRGRQAWLRGLIRLHEGRLSDALAQYTIALGEFEAVGERDSAAVMSSLLAESLFSLGARSDAWRRQRDAVRQVPTLTVARRKHLVLLTTGLMCLDDQLPRAALEFQDAVIAAASAAGNRPSSLLNAYVQRARNRHTLGNDTGADEDLQHARDQLPRVDEASLRSQDQAEIWKATAVVRRVTAPAEAGDAATRAIEYFGQHDGQLFLPGLLLARARAARASGAMDRAEVDAQAAIAAFERQRDTVHEKPFREALFQDGWDAYDELMALRVAAGNTTGALDVAERARARTLLEDIVANREAAPASVSELQRRLPATVATLYFVSRPERLWIWVITSGGVRFFDRPVGATALRRSVERVRFAFTRDNRPGIATRAVQELFTQLIAPVQDAIARYPTLVIVPDGALHTLPVAALQDPANGRYLVESHVIAVSPSFNILVRAMQPATARNGPATARHEHALIVANTEPVIGPGINLPHLISARVEAASVAALYGADNEILIDDQATAAAFKRRLPDADVVHYSGHALSDARAPERSRLFLRAARAGEDGALYATDLRDIRLPRHPIIVLASCSTHAGGIAVAEGLQSLARPFLGAGASAVVATLWDVGDSDAGELFTAFHRRLRAGDGAAQALASVQREAIGRDRSVEAAARWAWAVTIGGVVKERTRKEM